MEIVRNLPVESPIAVADRLVAAMRSLRGNAARDDGQSFFILRQLEG